MAIIMMIARLRPFIVMIKRMCASERDTGDQCYGKELKTGKHSVRPRQQEVSALCRLSSFAIKDIGTYIYVS